jgi:hypothetical protein
MTTDKAKNIAALKRQLKSTTNATLKNALTKKIERLKQELEVSKTPAKEIAMQVRKATDDVNAMSKSDFNALIKKLAMKPEYSFLKGMTKQEIKDDLSREAKPVGWRFRGRTNFKKPTKSDIKSGNNVYYEGRRNRSDVIRPAKLAKGGGVSNKELITTDKELVLYHYTDNDKPIISTKTDRLIPMSLSASNSSGWSSWGENKFEIILPKNTKILKVDNKTFWDYGKEVDTPINRGKAIYKKAKAKNVDVILLDKIAGQPIEYCILNNNFTFKKIMKGAMYEDGGNLKPIPAGNKGLPKLPKEVRNRMGYMAEGGGVGEVDMLKEDDFVWNNAGRKLVVDKVTEDEYFLSGFMPAGSFSVSKQKAHEYIKTGYWSLQPKYANGGAIKNQYKGKSYNEIWDNWTNKQRQHFIEDHLVEFMDVANTWSGSDAFVPEIITYKSKDLPYRVYNSLVSHIKSGQYGNGGGLGDYTQSLGMVKVKFSDPKYNYETNVSGSLTEKDVRDYFVGKSFNVASYPNEIFEKVVDVEFFPKGTYAEGGMMNANEENREMVMNNNVQIAHHAEELKKAVKSAKHVPAWVVAKVYEATTALSNVTHYLDGTNKMAEGGGIGKVITVETHSGKIEYSNNDIQEMIDDIDMYISSDNLPKWLYVTGKSGGNPTFPKNKKQVIDVLHKIKNAKGDVYINVSSKEPYFKHIIKYSTGGGVGEVKEGDFVMWDGKKYKVGKEDKEIKNFYLLNIDGSYAENPNGSALMVHKNRLKKMAEGGSLKGNQHKLDMNKNGRLDSEDFKILRGKK